MDLNSKISIARLTALWALAESGLGGYMHAMSIPFTGIFVGGTAVLILSLIAFNSPKPFQEILKSLAIVLCIKFIVSPQSPPPAYLAVAFQGIMAALLFSSPLPRKLSILLFILIAMWESAIQKFFVTTIFYGNEIWKALDELSLKIGKELGIALLSENFTFKVIAIYLLIYSIWALILSYWAIKLPKLIQLNREDIKKQLDSLVLEKTSLSVNKTKKKRRKWISIVLILTFLIASLFLSYSKEQALEKAFLVVGRTLLILVLYLYALPPLFSRIMKKWGQKITKNESFKEAISDLPFLKQQLPIAWQLSKRELKKYKRPLAFLLNLLILSLYRDESDNSI